MWWLMWWTPWPSLFSTNPCGEVALGAAEPCVLGIKPRKVDFPLFDFDIVSVQPMPSPASSWVMGIDWAAEPDVVSPRPTGRGLRPFDPLWKTALTGA